jgi:hypothetical protein
VSSLSVASWLDERKTRRGERSAEMQKSVDLEN